MKSAPLGSNQNVSSLHDKTSGVLDILPLAIAVLPWGILCGSLAVNVGFSGLEAWLMSALVFAGAAQLGGLMVLSQGGSIIPLLGSTLIISSRHLLYSASFREDVRKLSTLKRMVIAFLLTDEMFAVTQNYKTKTGLFSVEYAIASGLTFYFLWNISTLLGVVLGTEIPSLTEIGLDFAIAATFIAMIIPSLKELPFIAAAIISFITVHLLNIIGFPQSLLAASLLGMALGYFLDLKRGDK